MSKVFKDSASRPEAPAERLRDTQDAFDSVAGDYDGPRGNNALIQRMRARMWHWLDSTFSAASRLIDVGCGTGLDAIRMARLGHHVTAIDWSPRMVQRTRERAEREQLCDRVRSVVIGGHELERLEGNGVYDGAYSDLGPLNCVPDLAAMSAQCARLIKPGGALVFTVIGRLCPWELLHYGIRGRWARAKVRFARGFTPVSMNGHTIWTHYYWPREFGRAFSGEFSVSQVRGLCILSPPPYLTWLHERYPKVDGALWRIDQRLAAWPVVRSLGDHFMIILRRR